MFADLYERRGMSRRYGEEIDCLKEWFFARLAARSEPLTITNDQRRIGIDAMPDDIKAMANEAFNERLAEGYELSHNQMCVAFFAAVDQAQTVE